MKTSKPINAEATYERVRLKYISILAFCRAHKFNSQLFYQAVRERRGKASCAHESHRILKVLSDESLLVRIPDDET
jgi:hypothetical protein